MPTVLRLLRYAHLWSLLNPHWPVLVPSIACDSHRAFARTVHTCRTLPVSCPSHSQLICHFLGSSLPGPPELLSVPLGVPQDYIFPLCRTRLHSGFMSGSLAEQSALRRWALSLPVIISNISAWNIMCTKGCEKEK